MPISVPSRKRAFFLVHEYTGLPECMPPLADYLRADFAFHELRCAPLGEPQRPTMEQLAARLIESMVTMQPRGPYRLAGWSFGGMLAYEVAVQLAGRDEAVEFLGLIDATLPTAQIAALLARSGERAPGARLLELIRAGREPRRPGDTRCNELGRLFAESVRADQASALDFFDQLGEKSATLRFDEIVSRCRDVGLLPAALSNLPDATILQLLERWAAHDHAIAHYAPFPVSIPVHLFEVHDSRACDHTSPGCANGWETLLQNGEIHFVRAKADERSATSDVARELGRIVKLALRSEHRAATGDARDLKSNTPEASYHPHIPIQRGAPDREPVVLIPGAGDNVATFLPFASALDADWGLHGLQPRGLDGVLVPHTSVEAAAQSYMPTVEKLSADARAPLHLIGHSFGGWVAMEIACRLQSRGHPPASLTVIDSEAPESNGILGRPYSFVGVVWNLIHALEYATGKSLGIAHDALLRAPQSVQWQMLHEGLVRARILRPNSGPRDLRGLVRTYGTALRTAYRPAVAFTGAARLALAADADNASGDAASRASHEEALHGWRRFAPRMTAWCCPGNHFTMLKTPHVEKLAQWWQSAFRPESRIQRGVEMT